MHLINIAVGDLCGPYCVVYIVSLEVLTFIAQILEFMHTLKRFLVLDNIGMTHVGKHSNLFSRFLSLFTRHLSK